MNQNTQHTTIVLSWGKSATEKDKELIARAPDLLKENEQLKEELKEIKNTVNFKKVETLNAELLEALKEVNRYFGKQHNKGKWAKRLFESTQTAIAKAEGKE